MEGKDQVLSVPDSRCGRQRGVVGQKTWVQVSALTLGRWYLPTFEDRLWQTQRQMAQRAPRPVAQQTKGRCLPLV